MIFDQLCAAIERHYPQERLMAWLKRASIFEFPGRLHEVAGGPEASAQWHERLGGREFIYEHFFLPMPVLAVEDTASCVVLIDTEPEQVGLASSRFALECLPMSTDIEEFGIQMRTLDSAEIEQLRRQAAQDKDLVVITLTHLNTATIPTDGKTGFYYHGEVVWMMVCSKRDGMTLSPQQGRALMAQDPSGNQAMLDGAIRNAMAALDEVMYFNQPKRFVVERAAARPRGALGKKARSRLPKLLRSHERPHFILLDPGEIREKIGSTPGAAGAPENGRRKPAPHPRRRHYRTYRSDRYREDLRGQTVLVPATWVGPEEGEYQGRRYRVRLDL